MRGFFAGLLTIVVCLYVVPFVFAINGLVWWNVLIPALHAYNDGEPYFDKMGKVFIKDLERPFTASVSAVLETHHNMREAFDCA